MGQMGAQRSASVAPGVLQAPGHAPAPQSPISNMNMHLGGNPMGQSNSVMAGGGRLSQGSMGVMPGMSGAMMPPPLVSRQGSLGPPNMSPRIPQGMGEQAQTSTGYPPLMNGADGMMSGAMQHQQSRQQSPQRPMSRASLNGLGPMGMGMGMGMNMPPGLQTPQQKAHGFAGQQPGAAGMNMMPGIQPPFLRPSTPSQAMSLGGHQHQQHIAQTPPRQSPGAAVGRGSAPPMSAPSTPGPLGPAANISAAPMTPARSGSEIPQATSGISQTPVSSAAPGSSAGVAPASAASSQTGPSTMPMPSLPPLPSTVRLNQAVTRLTAVPLAQSTTLIPPISDEDIANIKTWMETDRLYEARFTAMRDRTATEVKRSLHGSRPRWWEQDPVAENTLAMKRKKEPFKFEYPSSLTKDNVRRKGRRREGLKVPGKLKSEDANRSEQLVPIRLEFDVEHHKYRDTFVWNLNGSYDLFIYWVSVDLTHRIISDPIVTPEVFAQSVIDDYGLSSSYHSIITKSIQEQLSDYKAHTALLVETDSTPIDVDEEDSEHRVLYGRLDGAEDEWWTAWRSKLRNKDGFVRTGALLKSSSNGSLSTRGKKRRKTMDADSDVPMEVEMFEVDEERMHEEMRILIKVSWSPPST